MSLLKEASSCYSDISQDWGPTPLLRASENILFKCDSIRSTSMPLRGFPDLRCRFLGVLTERTIEFCGVSWAPYFVVS